MNNLCEDEHGFLIFNRLTVSWLRLELLRLLDKLPVETFAEFIVFLPNDRSTHPEIETVLLLHPILIFENGKIRVHTTRF